MRTTRFCGMRCTTAPRGPPKRAGRPAPSRTPPGGTSPTRTRSSSARCTPIISSTTSFGGRLVIEASIIRDDHLRFGTLCVLGHVLLSWLVRFDMRLGQQLASLVYPFDPFWMYAGTPGDE